MITGEDALQLSVITWALTLRIVAIAVLVDWSSKVRALFLASLSLGIESLLLIWEVPCMSCLFICTIAILPVALTIAHIASHIISITSVTAHVSTTHVHVRESTHPVHTRKPIHHHRVHHHRVHSHGVWVHHISHAELVHLRHVEWWHAWHVWEAHWVHAIWHCWCLLLLLLLLLHGLWSLWNLWILEEFVGWTLLGWTGGRREVGCVWTWGLLDVGWRLSWRFLGLVGWSWRWRLAARLLLPDLSFRSAGLDAILLWFGALRLRLLLLLLCLLGLIILDLLDHILVRNQVIYEHLIRLTTRASKIALDECIRDAIIAVRLLTARRLHWIYEHTFVDRALKSSLLQLLITSLRCLLLISRRLRLGLVLLP